ncbi:MAG: hypothetical protein LBQ76_02185 [Candidatus Fibromonas sp.]|jgi:hypothetical protein|nr:hypothetical protein [Candidatus Fibromonas sp.]
MEEFFSEKQKEALNFFQENLDKWANDPLHKLKHVIIYDNKLSGVFDTFEAALTEAVAKYPRDAFIIQQVVRDDEVINFIYSAVS